MKVDLTGQKFGRLTVVKDSGKRTPKKSVVWECKCDCGNTTFVITAELRNGHTKSCGCLIKDRVKEVCGKTNEYDLESYDYGVCYLRGSDKFFIFDKEDYDLIKDYCWRFDGRALVKNSACQKVHRIIMGVTNKNDQVDFINGNNLDVRKSNLRVATHQQTMMNHKTSSANKSGYSGVCFATREQAWRAYITYNKKRIDLGWYKNKQDAINARKKAEEKYFGEFAREEKYR